MKDKTVNSLKEIFDKFDEKKIAAKQVQEKIKTEKEVFLEDFAKNIANTIRPSFEEIGAKIKARGHGCDISTKNESQNSGASVTMTIYPDALNSRRGPAHEYPSISFIAEPSVKKVFVHTSTIMPGHGGSGSKRGEYRLDEVTQEIVETETVKFINDCFNR